ncbi:Ig-like domain-containing protein [Maribacter sp. Hel_I_7]|uniref:Ig-like domain-containing protein n=1 Tax=Maribacter sp. Hel_I_7 TaxID=1249997 RepID=UPI00047D0039|nr:Ig-like domain-containing protein [Maribacter sp. Hel_I_7]
MMRNLQNPTRMAVFLCLLFIFQSCSKDSDLLSEYVISKDNSIEIQNYVVNDIFYLSSSNNIILDVLNNDNFTDLSNVNITETSVAQNGSIVINNDNTLTYTPQEEIIETEDFTDTFTYTAEEVDEEGTVTEEEATVTITNDDSFIDEETSSSENTHRGPNEISERVKEWQEKFDAEWLDIDQQTDSADALSRAKSNNINQEYYFLGYYIDGLVKMWQATGDNSYLDEALKLINITMTDAVNVGNGYLGWPNNDNDGHPLWDSFYWRYVATLTRIMHQSPNLRATGNYQQQYENLLAFSEKNIWERYEAQGLNNFYRINTHMTTHWARIGMELYIITGKEKYNTVFENVSFGTMVGRPSNLRNQLKPNNKVPSAVTWSQRWDIDQIQDTSHAGAIVSFIVTAYENNMYWTEADITALTSTVNNVIWKKEYGSFFMYNVDGTGDYDLHGRLHDWLNLGRYDESLQQRIKEDYIGKNLTFYGIQPLGIAALNAKILEDGYPVYPEQ